jgi:hypothetical protein
MERIAMAGLGLVRRAAGAAVLATGTMAAAIQPSGAAVISDTATLPLLHVPYVASAGAGCFPAAGVCIGGGSLTLVAPVSSTFDATGQDIVSAALYSGVLTTLSHVPIGSIALSGTVEQEVLGRTFATEIGSWTTKLLSLSLSGPLLGHTLSVALDPAHESAGITAIEPVVPDRFRITSFFDVFVELTLDTPVPLHTTRGPIHTEAVPAVPEPSGLAMLAAALAIMLAASRWRDASPPAPGAR